MEKLAVVVLGAGLGKRMGSDLPKVAVSTRERPLIQHVLRTAASLNPEKIIVVTGHRRETVEERVREGADNGLYQPGIIEFAFQEEQRGTGDAVKAALPQLAGFVGTVLILYGDVPLTHPSTLRDLVLHHQEHRSTVSLLILRLAKPTAYGRIVRSADGEIKKIVEVRDCSPSELRIDEHNSGIYAVDSAFLRPALEKLTAENKQNEYYLTDIIERAASEGQRVEGLTTENEIEVQGVNTRADLALVNRALQQQQIETLILNGVEVEDPSTLYLDPDVRVDSGARIGPNVQIRGKSSIATGVVIEGTAYIADSSIGMGSHIKLGVRIDQSVIGQNAAIGPFAHVRPQSVLGDEVKVGNFVETKNAQLHRDVKASHLTYLGDCVIGENTNIGAGTITCNYDGVNKHRTTIGKNVFIGSDSCLVAPVTVDDGAFVGAGSVITKDVGAGSLALGRAHQVNKQGWTESWRKKTAKKK